METLWKENGKQQAKMISIQMYERGWVQMVRACIFTTLKKGQESEGCHTMINEENGKLIRKVEEEIVMD